MRDESGNARGDSSHASALTQAIRRNTFPGACFSGKPVTCPAPRCARLVFVQAGFPRASQVVSTEPGGNISAVPTVSRFYGIAIAMYFDDHGHPHFHAWHAGREAKVRFDQVEVIENALDVRQLRLVLAWAELHREELLENWRRARAGETLQEIEPLR